MTISYLLARQRSGTHALRSILNKTNDIKAIGEILYSAKLDTNNQTQFWNYYYKLIQKDPSSILDTAKVFDKYLNYVEQLFPTKKHFMFDIKYNSINTLQPAWPPLYKIDKPYLIEKILIEKRKVINLTRYNYLRQIASEEIARANSLYATESDVEKKIKTIRLDPKKVYSTMQTFKKEEKIIRNLFKDYPYFICIDYDDLFFNKRVNSLKEIGEFLNVDIKDMTPTFVKLNKNKLTEIIINYDEIEKELTNTEFEYCLSDILSTNTIEIIRFEHTK